MRNALLAWQDEVADRAAVRHEAERLAAAANLASLSRCWRQWRCLVDAERASREELQRCQARLAGLRRAQVQQQPLWSPPHISKTA